MIPTVKVYSMVAVQTSHVILGTESGHLLVYDGYSYKKSHELSPLRDAILCLQFLKYVHCIHLMIMYIQHMDIHMYVYI